MKKNLLFFAIMLSGLLAISQSVNITFNVNMNGVTVDPGGVFIAGGSGFGFPGDNPMTDLDGDGIYTITISKAENFSSHYIFLNGNCGDWSCKEDIAGQACSDPANFNDRFIGVGTNDTVVSTCFGLCTEGTDCSGVKFVDITVNLDMSGIAVDSTGVYVAGGGSFGIPGDYELTDPDGDSIYSGTFSKPENFASFYTFANGACGDFSCKEDIAGQSCADPNNFNDRYISVGTSDTAICTAFAQCVFEANCEATSINRAIVDNEMFTLQPNRSVGETTLKFASIIPGQRNIEVLNLSGQTVLKAQVPGSETSHTLSLAGLSASLYFVKINQDGKVGIRKLQVMD